jgi:hypothetical protein
MTCRGKVTGGVVVLEKPDLLPEGAVVQVQPVQETNVQEDKDEKELQDLRQTLLRWSGTVSGLPPDMARNHDHYLHGRPKK